MGRVFESIMPEHEAFMKGQPLFFVGTVAATGHVNLSPKGYDTFLILSANRVAYLDLTGSGNETSYEGERNQLIKWAENKGSDGLESYWKEKNTVSMDGITTPLGKRIGEKA